MARMLRPTRLTEAQGPITCTRHRRERSLTRPAERLWQMTSPGRFRAATAFLLLAPGTPLLFQGQEFASSSPFLFFLDSEPEQAESVARGRATFLAQFTSMASPEMR